MLSNGMLRILVLRKWCEVELKNIRVWQPWGDEFGITRNESCYDQFYMCKISMKRNINMENKINIM